jgi:hypothetical protein
MRDATPARRSRGRQCDGNVARPAINQLWRLAGRAAAMARITPGGRVGTCPRRLPGQAVPTVSSPAGWGRRGDFHPDANVTCVPEKPAWSSSTGGAWRTPMRAAGLEPGVYASGCRIDAAAAAHIPESVIGRVLRRQEALALLVPKKPPAPSLTR